MLRRRQHGGAAGRRKLAFPHPEPRRRLLYLPGGRGRHDPALPISERQVYGWINPPDVFDRDPAVLPAAFAGFPRIVATALEAALADRSGLHRSRMRDVGPKFELGDRTVLIGDAAHAMAPVWGQGAALAMEDAVVLAELLSEEADWNSVPARFAARRRARVEHVRRATDAASPAVRLPVLIRNLAMPLIGPSRYRSAYGPLKLPA